MKAEGLIELLVCVIVGLGSVIEGARLTRLKIIQFDPFGPGRYNIGLGVILIVLGILYFVAQRRKAARAPKTVAQEAAANRSPVDKARRAYTIMMVSIIAILALYALLINRVGYLLASAVFFFLVNRAVGTRSWRVNLAATAIMTASYYVIFVKCMGMIFPQGTWLRL